MRSAYLLLISTLLLLVVIPVTRGRYNDDFDDGEDIVDFDDNDFAEFEDMNEDQAAEAETDPPPRVSQSSQPEEEEDEDEATVELEDGQDGFEDSETQVYYLFWGERELINQLLFNIYGVILIYTESRTKLITCFHRIRTCTASMTRKSLRGLETWRRQATP